MLQMGSRHSLTKEGLRSTDHGSISDAATCLGTDKIFPNTCVSAYGSVMLIMESLWPEVLMLVIGASRMVRGVTWPKHGIP